MTQHTRLMFASLALALVGLLGSSTAMAQDCDPNEDPECFCFNEIDGSDCSPGDADCTCFGGDEPVYERPCSDFFLCAEECGEEDIACASDCADGLSDPGERGAFRALISCVESSGCSAGDEDCLENACRGETQNIGIVCSAPYDENNGTSERPCEEFYYCADNCDDLSCIESCASTLPNDAKGLLNEALSCIESSGCDDESQDCVLDACADQLNAFNQTCSGRDVTDGGGTSNSNGVVSGNTNGEVASEGSGGDFSNLFGGNNRNSDSDNEDSGDVKGSGSSDSGCSMVGFGPVSGSGFAGLLVLGLCGLAVRRRRS